MDALEEQMDRISIPALREEGDCRAETGPVPDMGISIPALREEGDPQTGDRLKPTIKFLSPPSARRATHHRHRLHRG